MSKVYKIGTRGSLLAVTQCTLIKEELERLSGQKFELELIKTQGDLQTEKPLWQIDGKDFFTKELDEVLLQEKVDLVVHSYKDLGSLRPEGIHLAAVTERSFPNDILLIKKSTVQNLKNLKEFVVGTSSPRRMYNIEHSLKNYLPNLSEDSSIKTESLRGNVNTRIEKLRSGQYHAIVLAHAGLERLALREDSREILEGLLEGLTFLVLPQKDFPSCASQGALGIEIKESRKDELLPILNTVHHQPSFQDIAEERKAFNSYGGGCHLAVGIHVKSVADKRIKIEKGSHNQEEIRVTKIMSSRSFSLEGKKIFAKAHEYIEKKPIQSPVSQGALFVTSSHCFHNIPANFPGFLFTAGNRTAKSLVSKGLWVHGSAESFGHQEIIKLKSSEVLQILMQSPTWYTLSHESAETKVGTLVPSYKREFKAPKSAPDADIYFWTSFYQYQKLTEIYPDIKNKTHCCGLGKTYLKLREEDIELVPFTDMKEFNNYAESK